MPIRLPKKVGREMTEPYKERELKKALIANISAFFLNSAPGLLTSVKNIVLKWDIQNNSLICCSIT